MDLKSGYPFWLIKDGLPFSYPKLDHDLETDVAIVGAGVSGALMRYYLMNAGIECVTIDARTVGLGSTCASTSLLQYEIDVPLFKLIDICGKEAAERAYKLCDHAISELGEIANRLGFKDFEYKKSLYFAAHKKDFSFLKKEFSARKNAGFNVEFLTQQQIEEDYLFSSAAAILSHHGAQMDSYAFTHILLQYKNRTASNIFDRTSIVKTRHLKDGVKLITESGHIINAKKVVFASGYEVTEMLDKKIVSLLSTYVAISEQFDVMPHFNTDAIMWNTAEPYLYIRSTHDGRILIGGRDEDFYNPERRDELIKAKTKQLEKDFNRLFPGIGFKSEFSWCGTFGSTKDGLPYIGSYKKYPHSYFALGFGGNGITFALIAAEIITDMILGKENDDAHLFSFERFDK